MRTFNLLPLLLSVFLLSSFTNNDSTARIRLYKASSQQLWEEVKGVTFDNNDHPVLNLECDAYYTVQISQLNDLHYLENFSAVVGNNPNEKKFELDLLALSLKKETGMENYFTEFPFGIVSCTQRNTTDYNIYTILIKTKSKTAEIQKNF